MKKFFSLLCAMMLVLSSVCAAPRALSVGALKHEHRVLATQAKQVAANRPVKKMVVKAQPKKAVAAKAHRAPQAVATTQVVADDILVKYYEDTEDWYLEFFAEGMVYCLDVYCTNPLELPTGTYTFDDMEPYYCVYGPDTDQYLNGEITDATLVVSENEYGKCYYATITLDSGEVVEITFEAQPIPEPTEIVDLTFDASQTALKDYVESDGMFQFQLKADTVTMYFACYAEEIEGAYTLEDVISQYSGLMINGQNISIAALEGTVTEIEGGFEGHLDVIGWNGLGYSIDFVYMYPVAGEPIEIIATNLVVETQSFWDIIFWDEATASDGNYMVSISTDFDGSIVAGTFTEEDFAEITVTNLATDAEDAIEAADITVAIAGGATTITGVLIGSYGQEYDINLTYVLPDPTSQVSLTIADAEISDATATYGAFVLVGEDAENYVQLYIISDVVAGTYTEADLYAAQSAVILGEDLYTILTANVTITVSGTTATATGTLLVQNSEDASDVVEVTLNLTATVEEYEEGGMQYDEENADFTASYTNAEFDREYLAQYGSIMVEAYSADSTTMVVLDFNLIGGAEDPAIVIPAGTYTIDGTYAPGTVSASEGVATTGGIYPSFAGTVDEEGYLSSLWFLEDGTVTVSNDNGNLHIVVAATNSYGRSIDVTIDVTMATALKNVDAAAKVTKAIKNGQLVIEKNGVKFNAQGAKL